MSDELNEDRQTQRELHDSLTQLLPLGESELLNSWVIVFETVAPEGDTLNKNCGHIYGPETQTTWGSLGLIEWARKHLLVPDEDYDD